VLELSLLLVVCSALLLAATWLGYPVWLSLRARPRKHLPARRPDDAWPTVSIVVVVQDAEAALRPLLESLLAMGYPAERRRILVVSNASRDFTDAVASLYADRGVELLRVMRRHRSAAGAENFARKYVDSEVVIVVHPEARPRPAALSALVQRFADPTVGVAYGREISAALAPPGAKNGGSLHDRFEGWLRDRETQVFGTVVARRALYALRTALYRAPLSAALSPDFAPILIARERGFRAVYAGDAEAVMLRERSPRGDYGQRIRTVTRDVATLLEKPHLLDPRRYGAFSFILLGHKLGRWLSPWAALAAVVGLVLLAPAVPWARAAVAVAALLGLSAALTWDLPAETTLGRALVLPGRLAASGLATALALVRALADLHGAAARVPVGAER
jgi:glycosyltransferase involved in cell wall biosynthesis